MGYSTHDGGLRFVPDFRGDRTASSTDGSAYQHMQRAIRTRRAGDPRDKSYGLYGVLKASGVRLAEASYRKPVGLVYQELCLDLLHWGRSLNLILDAGLPAFPEAASWTPRWDLAETPARAWLDPTYIYSEHGQEAVSKSLSSWRIEADAQLVIRGCFRGTVNFRTRLFRSGQDFAPKFLDAFNEIRFRMRLRTESDTVFAAISEVLYARVKSRTPSNKTELFQYWFQSLVTASSMMASTSVQLAHWRELIQRDREAEQYHRDIGEQLTGRRFLVTSDGLLGTCSSTVAVGDQIVLGSGIAMPLVLRSTGASGGYTLVGPAFIHGMMEGEMWTGEDLEDIVLI